MDGEAPSAVTRATRACWRGLSRCDPPFIEAASAHEWQSEAGSVDGRRPDDGELVSKEAVGR
eukprot:3102225-Pleurochrysis_carterae.AAC.1